MANTLDSTHYLYKRLLGYVLAYWPMFAFGLLATAIYSGLDAFAAYALKPLINKGFVDRDVLFIKWVPLGVLVIFVLRGVTAFASSYCVAAVARRVVMDLRQKLFAHLQQLPARFYDQSTSGKLLSKLLYDVEQVAQVSTDAILEFVQSFCFVLGLLIVMLSISWKLSLIFFVTAPFMVLIIRYANTRVRRVSTLVQQNMGRVTEIAEEAIGGYREVRIYGGQAQEIAKFNRASNDSRRGDMKVVAAKAYSVSGVQAMAAFAIAGILYFAINPNPAMGLSAGAFASMLVAMLALLKPLKNLTKVNGDIQKGLAGARSIFALFDNDPEQDEGDVTLSRVKGQVAFQQVCFAYNADQQVLHDVSFTIEPGQTVALVGRSGSGKTTLAMLMNRFYDCTSGKIVIDGHPLSSLRLADLRRQVAFVSQQVTLFNGTIYDNIAYGEMAGASREQVIAAAHAAHAMEFIERFPDGFDTMIGDNGVLLSGGQRQRIAIARAILKDAPILILDEATSALDTEAERSIQSALDTVMKNRSTLVIAHRLSTIENADLIIVLAQGRIVEAGTHQQLLAQQGHYAKLHSMQFKTAYGSVLTA